MLAPSYTALGSTIGSHVIVTWRLPIWTFILEAFSHTVDCACTVNYERSINKLEMHGKA